jgi:hypothetical protein
LNLRKECCARPTLANPDFKLRLYIDTDASNTGYGFQIYHASDERGITVTLVVRESPPPSEAKDVIMYGSKAWTVRETRMPTYYQEAYALFYALRRCRYYIDSSPYVTVVYTDHAPLRWIQNSSSDRLTSWTLEEFAGMTYRIEYIPGSKNSGGDAMSREPVIPQRPLQRVGFDSLITDLLHRLDSFSVLARDCRKLWFWSGPDTTDGARRVQRWRRGTNPVMVNSPSHNAMSQDWDFAILMPSGGMAPGICAQLFQTQKKFACLVPSDLVNWIALEKSTERNEQMARSILQAHKIVYLDTTLTWDSRVLWWRTKYSFGHRRRT